MVTIAVGDVHGCGVELRGLLAAVDRAHRGARIVFVGDLLTKGPAPEEVVREILDRRDAGQELVTVCGNHDLRLLAALVQVQSGVSPANLAKTERQCWHQLAKHGMLRLAMRLMVEASENAQLRDRDGRWTVMHAGIDPTLGLAETPEDVKIHIKAPEGQPHWWERYDGRDGLIIVGHKPVPEPMVLRHPDGRPYVVNVDSGCTYGGWPARMPSNRTR
ncbi:MAG: metallophosphoesterase [Phycisphaerales bacterium]